MMTVRSKRSGLIKKSGERTVLTRVAFADSAIRRR
jgi:hypothetical protein